MQTGKKVITVFLSIILLMFITYFMIVLSYSGNVLKQALVKTDIKELAENITSDYIEKEILEGNIDDILNSYAIKDFLGNYIEDSFNVMVHDKSMYQITNKDVNKLFDQLETELKKNSKIEYNDELKDLIKKLKDSSTEIAEELNEYKQELVKEFDTSLSENKLLLRYLMGNTIKWILIGLISIDIIIIVLLNRKNNNFLYCISIPMIPPSLVLLAGGILLLGTANNTYVIAETEKMTLTIIETVGMNLTKYSVLFLTLAIVLMIIYFRIRRSKKLDT